MKIKSPLVVAALVLAFGSVTLTLSSNLAFAQAAAPAELPKIITPELAKPFNELRDLIVAKDYVKASEKIASINSLPKNAYELFFLERLKAIIAVSTKDTAGATKSAEAMLASPYLKGDEKAQFLDVLARKNFEDHNYDQAKIWALKSLEAKDVPSTHEFLGRIYYFSKDYPNAAKELQSIIDADLKESRTPTLENLQILLSSYQLANDKSNGASDTLEVLVKYYPSSKYWGMLLSLALKKAHFDDHLSFDWYRLGFETESIDDGDYFDYAQFAIQAGYPGEAKKVLEFANANGIVGAGKDSPKYKKLHDQATRQLAEDTKIQNTIESSARSAKNGIGLTNLGFNFVLNGEVDRGIALMEEGIAKGGLKALEETKLHLVIAYVKAGNKAKAEETFKSMSPKDGNAVLAKLWVLRAK